MMNQYLYYLTAVSDIKESSKEKGDYELSSFFFEAKVEAGMKGLIYAKIFILGKPSLELLNAVKSRRRFAMKLTPQPDGTFLAQF